MLKIAKKVLSAAAIAAIVLLAYQFFVAKPPSVGLQEEYHAHADFAVFINGEKLNFSQKQFMHEEACGKPGETHAIDLNSEEGRKEAAHLHDLNGNVMHLHHENATLAIFFKNAGFTLTRNCLETPQGKYCNTESRKLKVFDDGLQVQDLEKFVPKDAGKILVTYGSESAGEVRAQNEQLTSQACIYSGKCAKPAGFVITPESCGD